MALHFFDAARFERILFGHPLGRSISQADPEDFRPESGPLPREFLEDGFDGLWCFGRVCAELRDFVENTVCANLFQQVLGDGETASAILNDAL